MQKFFSKYALAAHLALTVVAPLFLSPFFGVEKASVALLWLSLFSALWIILEPSRKPDEYLYNTRKRVYKSIIRDPLFILFALLLVVVVVRWLNNGIRLEYRFIDTDWSWIVSMPRLDWLPGSDSNFGFISFSTFIAVTIVVLACRHALGKSARLMFIFLSTLFAGITAMAVVIFTCKKGDIASLMAISECKVYSMAGSSFGLFFLASIVAFAGMFERGWQKAMLLFSFATGSTFLGLWFFAPSAVTVFYASVGGLVLVVTLGYLSIKNGVITFFKCLVALLIAATIPACVMQFIAPDDLVDVKLSIFGAKLFTEEFINLRRMYTSLAAETWLNGNIWLGTGLGSLSLYIRLNFAESFWVKFIPNGWWQVLVERGVVGMLMIVIPFLFLTYTLIIHIFKSQLKRSFWPLTILGVVSVVAVVTEGFYNSSFMRPELFVYTAALYSLGASALPISNKDDDNLKN